MKLRHLLVAPTFLLGLLLLVLAGIRFHEQSTFVNRAEVLSSSDAVRANLLQAAVALGDERFITYAALSGMPFRGEIAEARALTDARTSRADDALGGVEDATTDTLALRRAILSFTQTLAASRAQADAALALSAGTPDKESAARGAFDAASAVIAQEQDLRLRLLRADAMHSLTLQIAGRMRFYSGILYEAISQNAGLIYPMTAPDAQAPEWVIRQVVDNIGRADLALELLRTEGTIPEVEAVMIRIDSFAERYLDQFETVLPRLGGSASVERTAGEEWVLLAQEALREVSAIQNDLVALSRTGVEAELRSAHFGLLLSSLVMLLAVSAVIASYFLTRSLVVNPLERTINTMLRLAKQDLETPVPEHHRRDEFYSMSQALRVFKANMIRKERLSESQKRLHARLRESYRSLREDLRAAAAIQTTLLPAPGKIGHLAYRGLYRPASVVAGDTFNVLQQADGSIGFFQVDVAGHGAPAALGSVVSHHNLSQTIVKRTDGTPLATIAEGIDRDWPEDLPYFTMVFGEICLRRSRLQFVQAGHPPPIMIRRDGSVEFLGEGGLPVGLVPGARYDVTETRFAEGDRLLIYSDGVSEASAPDGRLLGQERLVETIGVLRGAEAATMLEELSRW